MSEIPLAEQTRILVVDDSRIVRATIRKHLSDTYDIIEEADGEAGWRRLQFDPTVQLLISDLTMPELDGLGLLARVRSCPDPRIQQIPVIIISGEEDEATRRHCVQCGASDFVTKSTDRSEMQARVKANLELANTRRDLVETRAVQEQTSTTDIVTGAATPHLLALQLDQSYAFAKRHNSQVALVMVEIDLFVPMRDKLGERAAGQMLGMLAKLLATKLRREDTLAHVDGPLFAVASPGATYEGCKILAERLQQTVANARINFRNEQLRLTASVAAANSALDAADDAEGFFNLALQRLHSEQGNERLLLPSAAKAGQQQIVPSLTDALSMLQKGDAESVVPHLHALLASVSPLLDLANKRLGLGWSLDKIRH